MSSRLISACVGSIDKPVRTASVAILLAATLLASSQALAQTLAQALAQPAIKTAIQAGTHAGTRAGTHAGTPAAMQPVVQATAQNFSVQVPGSRDHPLVIMRTTKGELLIELNVSRAPETVENFLRYVDDGFYTNTVFHRVIDGFMIQGGGFTENYQRKRTKAPVTNEAYNGLKNLRYSIAMARTTAPHSATSQFFINTSDNPRLDHVDVSRRGWGYAVFGRVIQGQEVVDAISSVRTSAGGSFSRDVPVDAVVIREVRRFEPTQLVDGHNDNRGFEPKPDISNPAHSQGEPSAEAATPAIPTARAIEVGRTQLGAE